MINIWFCVFCNSKEPFQQNRMFLLNGHLACRTCAENGYEAALEQKRLIICYDRLKFENESVLIRASD